MLTSIPKLVTTLVPYRVGWVTAQGVMLFSFHRTREGAWLKAQTKLDQLLVNEVCIKQGKFTIPDNMAEE